jgi:lipid A 3-O-deacylase
MHPGAGGPRPVTHYRGTRDNSLCAHGVPHRPRQAAVRVGGGFAVPSGQTPGRRGIALIAALTILSLAGPRASAQTVGEVQIEEANAQLDFWLPARRRPDTELTNSASLRVTTDGARLLSRLIRVPACGDASATTACATTEFQLGQEIYTPAGATHVADPEPGARPYAGWLYVAGTTSVTTPAASESVILEGGVTGTPSLAEQIQTAWHELIGYPRPLGWSHQIPFVPGVLIGAERTQAVARASIGGVPVLSIMPTAGMSLGNVLTGANLGAEARIGYGVTPPWSAAIPGRGRRVEIYGIAAAREDLIAYELFLDGSTTQPATHVEKEPTVFQYEFGVGARAGRLELEYLAITREREYTTGPPIHPYAVLAAGVRPGW